MFIKNNIKAFVSLGIVAVVIIVGIYIINLQDIEPESIPITSGDIILEEIIPKEIPEEIDEEPIEKIVVDNPSIEIFSIETERKIVYRVDNDLISFDPNNSEKTIILSSDDILEFDLSEDQKFLAYTLKTDSPEGYANLFLKDLTNDNIIQLAEEENIIISDPKIFPDNSKVAYVKRIYSPNPKRLSDGEIWMINIDGSIESSEKLFGSNDEYFISDSKFEKLYDENGEWVCNDCCMLEEELKSVKIGITSISPDNSVMLYWKRDWLVCPGLYPQGIYSSSYFSNLDGSDFITPRVKEQSTFVINLKSQGQIEDSWQPRNIYFLPNGNFVVRQSAPGSISGSSIYYFDNQQNKKWEIYDSFKENANEYDIQILLEDITLKNENKFILVYKAYYGAKEEKYFIEELTFGDNIDIANLDNKNYFATDIVGVGFDSVDSVKLLDDRNVIYMKETGKDSYGLYLYNIAQNGEMEIIKSDSIIEFDI